MKYFVVSGATGLLGNSIINNLQNNFPEAQVISLQRGTHSNSSNSIISWNLPDNLPNKHQLPARFTFIHMANLLKSTDPKQFNLINVEALNHFLSRFEDQIEAIIWSSSLSVLGQGPFNSAREQDQVNPQTPLAISRHNQEELILNFSKNRGIPCIGLRGRLYIGEQEQDFNRYLRLILKFPILAFNSGQTKISVISANDYAEVLSLLIKKNIKTQELFNLAYQTPLHIAQYLEIMGIQTHWRTYHFILSIIKYLIPKKIASKYQTKIELLGQNQIMNVSKLKEYIGNEIIDRDPHEIVMNYIKIRTK